jgi:hypothetical protein
MMNQDLATERDQAHAYLDLLPADQLTAVRGLLESMLSPLDRRLARAPIDDEPVTPDEEAAIAQGLDSLRRNGGVSLEIVLADFGLTMEDFRRMAETPSVDENNGDG